MPHKVHNVSASILARLRNVATASGADFLVILSRYVLERLLYRLSLSPYRERFILKGALLFPLWFADTFRPTRDLDLLGSGDPRPDELARVFRAVMSIERPEDGVVFDVGKLQAAAIRNAAEYDGVRIRSEAHIGNARLPVQIDVGFGDVVVPPPAEIDYPVLLDAPAPRLRVYPKETVVAEKFEAIVALGADNSRMKDFYDLWVISREFGFEGATLTRALLATFERRGTPMPVDVPSGLSDAFAGSPEKQTQWRAFVARGRLSEQPASFGTVVTAARDFLMPLAAAARRAETLDAIWNPGGPWCAAKA
ncbi:nucleotidyl transferase AbiEii/AbiGii toxin family protein [Verrucomicrobium sp. 3C]|uniref:nucleotidyl transferase AbiEii/AbiGii toxin family protein n=1 Tax=Verrucomicrobium sp. 3C TaxID=1134055 RepID=UPI00037D4161|nr:nucleotidyl transferase AbiEii/AbiGii toxin family protein [Verrucomicrobium sp. 3C]